MSASARPAWRWSVVLLLSLCLPAGAACAGPGPAEGPGPGEVPGPGGGPPPPTEPPTEPPAGLGAGARVLLIGNSLTAANDLRAMVEALADSAGLQWIVEARAPGGASLEDQWAAAEPLIRGHHWDAVVLQQGPSSLPDSRAHLRHWAAVYDDAIRDAGGRTALYMVWPERVRLEVFDRVRDSYALAAVDVHGLFLPAGEVWRAAWRRDAALALYGLDGFHPSQTGSYAAALAIFARLADRTPEGLPGTLTDANGGTLVSVPPSLAVLLQEAAAEAVARYRDYRPADLP